MAEFTIDGVQYRSGKMAARTQVHVLRRMGKMIDPLFRLMGGGVANEEALSAFGEAIGALSDDEVDYVMDHCLGTMQRKQGEVWSKVMTSDGKTCMFQDMDAAVQLQALAHVLRDNYEPLFQKALATWNGGGSLSA